MTIILMPHLKQVIRYEIYQYFQNLLTNKDTKLICYFTRIVYIFSLQDEN